MYSTFTTGDMGKLAPRLINILQKAIKGPDPETVTGPERVRKLAVVPVRLGRCVRDNGGTLLTSRRRRRLAVAPATADEP
jgi:hypothetical protein